MRESYDFSPPMQWYKTVLEVSLNRWEPQGNRQLKLLALGHLYIQQLNTGLKQLKLSSFLLKHSTFPSLSRVASFLQISMMAITNLTTNRQENKWGCSRVRMGSKPPLYAFPHSYPGRWRLSQGIKL